MLKLIKSICKLFFLLTKALLLIILNFILTILLIFKNKFGLKIMLPFTPYPVQPPETTLQEVLTIKNTQQLSFIKTYTATQTYPVEPHIIESYRHKVPPKLIEIWQTTGFGKYDNGLIEFINPQDYEQNLWEWLGDEKENYTPFAINAFGDMFYYRRLSESGDEDVCLLDIQYRKCEVLDWDFDDFLDITLTDNAFRKEWLRLELFQSAQKRHGHLKNGEVYMFTPIIALGNPANNVEFLDKGSAIVYQMLVLEMGKNMYK